jgi:hypothetical protein
VGRRGAEEGGRLDADLVASELATLIAVGVAIGFVFAGLCADAATTTAEGSTHKVGGAFGSLGVTFGKTVAVAAADTGTDVLCVAIVVFGCRRSAATDFVQLAVGFFVFDADGTTGAEFFTFVISSTLPGFGGVAILLTVGFCAKGDTGQASDTAFVATVTLLIHLLRRLGTADTAEVRGRSVGFTGAVGATGRVVVFAFGGVTTFSTLAGVADQTGVSIAVTGGAEVGAAFPFFLRSYFFGRKTTTIAGFVGACALDTVETRTTGAVSNSTVGGVTLVDTDFSRSVAELISATTTGLGFGGVTGFFTEAAVTIQARDTAFGVAVAFLSGGLGGFGQAASTNRGRGVFYTFITGATVSISGLAFGNIAGFHAIGVFAEEFFGAIAEFAGGDVGAAFTKTNRSFFELRKSTTVAGFVSAAFDTVESGATSAVSGHTIGGVTFFDAGADIADFIAFAFCGLGLGRGTGTNAFATRTTQTGQASFAAVVTDFPFFLCRFGKTATTEVRVDRIFNTLVTGTTSRIASFAFAGIAGFGTLGVFAVQTGFAITKLVFGNVGTVFTGFFGAFFHVGKVATGSIFAGTSAVSACFTTGVVDFPFGGITGSDTLAAVAGRPVYTVVVIGLGEVFKLTTGFADFSFFACRRNTGTRFRIAAVGSQTPAPATCTGFVGKVLLRGVG